VKSCARTSRMLAAACSGTLLLAKVGCAWGPGRHYEMVAGSRVSRVLPGGAAWQERDAYRRRRREDRGRRVHRSDLTSSFVRVKPALADLVVRYLLIGDRALQASFAAPAALGRHSSRRVGVRTVGTGTPWRADPDCTVEHRSGPVGRH
jgi:hypothetical protein